MVSAVTKSIKGYEAPPAHGGQIEVDLRHYVGQLPENNILISRIKGPIEEEKDDLLKISSIYFDESVCESHSGSV